MAEGETGLYEPKKKSSVSFLCQSVVRSKWRICGWDGRGHILCQVVVREWIRMSSLPVEFLLWQLCYAITAGGVGGPISLALLLLARSFAHFLNGVWVSEKGDACGLIMV